MIYRKFKWWMSQTVVKWFKQIKILGWVRFRILRIAYKIFWSNSPRNGEWDYLLKWLEPLREFQKPVTLLDVGSTESLLIHELSHRGYEITALDQRDYQEEIPYEFIKFDLTSDDILPKRFHETFDYILAVSTIEHIGLGAYGDKVRKNGDRRAMYHLHDLLKPEGYLMITVPNKHLGTDTGRGYSYYEFKTLIHGLFRIVDYTERSNQICATLVKCL